MKGFEKEAKERLFLEAGFPKEKVGNIKYKNGAKVTLIASILEFGKWPFLRKTLTESKNKNRRELRNIAKKGIRGKSMLRLLKRLGEETVKDIRNTIYGLRSPKLSPETVKQKKSRKILIGKEKLLAKSISYIVKKGKGKKK